MKNEFDAKGYVVLKNLELKAHVEKLKTKFEFEYMRLFENEISSNRNVIKRFADDFDVVKFFLAPKIIQLVSELGISMPVYCGPLVTHYTSNDETGGSFGLPYHQDYPSMGSSLRSVILWTNLNDSTTETHGLIVVPGSHKNGLLPGDQMETGYVIAEQKFQTESILELQTGDLVAMSPFLVHKTFVNPKYKGWKLSLSRRVDDLACKDWKRRGYENAYKTSVNRSLYLSAKL